LMSMMGYKKRQQMQKDA